MTESTDRAQVLDGFFNYLSLILVHYKNIIPVLKEELQLILQGDIALLDNNLKQQQVLLIQTKNFDRQVEEFSQRLGLQAKNLTELALQLEPDQQLRFFDLLAEFDTTITQVNFYKEKCRFLLQSKLYHLDKMLTDQGSVKEVATYDKNAAEIHRDSLHKTFEKKI